MSRRLRVTVLAGAALFTTAVFADGPSEDLATLAKELETVLSRLREVRAASYARQRTRADEIERARLPLRYLEGEIATLKAQASEVDRELEAVRSETARLEAEEKASAAARAALEAALAPAVENARARADAAWPYRREDRAARLAPALDPARPISDRFAGYWAHILEELRIARSGETFNADVSVDANRVKPARLFRVGHLVLGFLTEDGLHSGLWKDGRWELSQDDEQKERIRAAIEILDRRRGPELLPLPIEAEVRR